MTSAASTAQPAAALRRILVPLALAQFICSFAGSNMNVMISDIADDLNTTVKGVQTAITVFLLVMAALMIPGGKLTDRYGRTRLFRLGLAVYSVGAAIAAFAPNLGVLIVGYSVLQGVGTAMLIPPVYILTTLFFTGVTARARAFGVVSALGGVGAAAGPLIGGLITSAISWRAAFGFQALMTLTILTLSRRIHDPMAADPHRPFDLSGAVLSATGLVLLVMGTLAAATNLWLTVGLIAAGVLVLAWFFWSTKAKERTGRATLLSTSLFRNSTSNLGLITQAAQWLLLLGTSFTVASYLQVVRGYDAVQTGVIFTAATGGLLIASIGAERFAKRRAQRTLVVAGFVITIGGILVLLPMAAAGESAWAYAPGLLLVGFGLGTMLTPSVNVVQSSFPEELQGEISGLSRAVSNLGSCLGTAIAGTILVAGLDKGAYAAAMLSLGAAGLLGLVAALRLPRTPAPTIGPQPVPTPAAV